MTTSKKRFTNPFVWFASYFNKYVRFKLYGKLIICFEGGIVVHVQEIINRKPPEASRTETVSYHGLTMDVTKPDKENTSDEE